ncbi:MAG: RNA methyltransferase, partial [Anaerolineae bacterium]|nr:RNA methyltransferase [Anaerolineae bacterium]
PTSTASCVEFVIAAPDFIYIYNPKLFLSDIYAHFRVPLVNADWQEIAQFCQNVPVYLATGDADASYTAIDWTQPWALIVGNEAHGVSETARDIASTPVSIPMAAETESLNAATATAVILFEAARQRSIK